MTRSTNGVKTFISVRRMYWHKMCAPASIHLKRHYLVKFWKLRSTYTLIKLSQRANRLQIKKTLAVAGFLLH